MNIYYIFLWLWVFGIDIELKTDLTNPKPAISEIEIGVSDCRLLPIAIDSAETCIDCHEDHLDDEVVHSPVKKDCNRCHEPTKKEHPIKGEITFKLVKSVPKLCYECHDPKDEKKFIHDPVKQNECFICHDTHDGPNTYLVKSEPIGSICKECHTLDIPRGNHVHAAVSDGDCAGCHDPHQADDSRFLKTTKLDRLCRSCHRPIRKQLRMEVVHDPFAKKNCFDCHNAHSSKELGLIDMKVKDLCISCHEDTHNRTLAAKVDHDVMNSDRSCLSCHTAHASDTDHILFTNEKEVCLTCHDQPIMTEERTIYSIADAIVEGNAVHGPIIMEDCGTCHIAHGSDINNLLVKQYPFEQYSVANVENFELCFSCHDDTIFNSPTATTETNFRNGNQNMHYLHIQGSRGRNCNLCHDVHGSKNKHMIKSHTRYGNWNMPIKFEETENGGSCLTGCHQRYHYDRGKSPNSKK